MNADKSPSVRPAGRGTFAADFAASLVVFLVALPLCLGVAIASGVPPAMGLITGIVGGLVVGSLSGSPLQVSGPAAGLTVLVYQIVTDPNLGLAMLGIIVLGAGLLQFVMGLLRLGQWFRAVSPAVIHGMLAGIGALIFASQFHVMVDDKPKGSGIVNLISIPEAIEKGMIGDVNGSPWHREAAMIGLLTIAALVLWKLFAPKKLKVIPAPLVAILLATTLVVVLGWGVAKVELPANLANEIRWPTWERLSRLGEGAVLIAMLSIALIASAETLLCATAVDQLHSGPRTKYDRELSAQGVGNMICGVLGALPMTGVIVRSAANVEAGAKTRLSAILHGAWLLAAVLLLTPLMQMIPKAGLAAILVYTGYKLMNFGVIKELRTAGWGEVAIYLATLATIVGKDLLTGVVVGVILSMVKLLYTFSHLSVRLETEQGTGRTVLYLEGAATFIRLPLLASALERVPAGAELHVHMEELSFIDHACLELLVNWEKQHMAQGGSLVIDWQQLTARFHEPRSRPALASGVNGEADTSLAQVAEHKQAG